MSRLPIQSEQEEYVRGILTAYLHLPETASLVRRQDRQLALELHRRAIPISVVESAMLLASARRLARPPDAAPLSRIRSLHYFLPVIEEIVSNPIDGDYVEYLRRKISQPARNQKTADSDER